MFSIPKIALTNLLTTGQTIVPAFGVPRGVLGPWRAALKFVRNSAEIIDGGVQEVRKSEAKKRIWPN